MVLDVSHHPEFVSDSAHARRALLGRTLVALACVVAWDVAGGDLALAQPFGTANGFPWREQWFLVQVMHEGARRVGWLLTLLLTLAVWWPVGVLRRLDTAERFQMTASVLLALGVVSLAKHVSNTSCPWDLAQFGGVARHVSHWALGLPDGGGGRCFPAGHASAGFAFVGGYFALRRKAPTAARWWLTGSLLAGFVLGAVQQVRGAHFMSHTLWTAWLCWTTGWLCHLGTEALRPRFATFATTTRPSETSSASG